MHQVALVFRDGTAGAISVAHGRLVGADEIGPTVKRHVAHFDGERLERGAIATRVTVRRGETGFTFFLRDVTAESPILVRALGVAVVPIDDQRTYEQIEKDVAAKGLTSAYQQILGEPEETYEAACRATRDQHCPTWLGVGRDIRIFRVMSQTDSATGGLGSWGRVEPWNHSNVRDVPENNDAVRYTFVLGRGAMCSVDIERRLEDGSLPILRSLQRDGEVEYDLTAFATLETQTLSKEAVRGTHPVAALANTWGAMLTQEELAEYERLKPTEVTHREEELVCWVRVVAVNHASVPRYAYFRAAEWEGKSKFGKDGCSRLGDEVMALNRLDGSPMPQREMAILLQPGRSVTLDLLFPHRPVSTDRAAALASQSFDRHYNACRDYWLAKLHSGASISVPEKAIDERIKAGLLHLDINTLGLAKEGHLLAAVGWYAPIGSESSPMIQFYDSMGWHEAAERAIQFFLDRQRSDGFIETFGGYQLETGPVLWTIGEHFRYTGDIEWARRILPKALLACDYILAWRKRNQREEFRGKGYGLIDGKVADPEDFFHSFMLNGLAYVGLKRIAEVCRTVDLASAVRLESEVKAFLADIRTAYAENVVSSPVVPLGDGAWVPSFGPWAEYPGPVSLYAEGGDWYSHGAFACRDTLIGALYLGIGEVLDPHEPMAEWLLRSHQELMTHRNAGFTQPYYCRHDWLHLKRGEVKAFLKTYYNQLASLQDRETYTFWEHYFGVSQHKTHEEGWFLMQTRWMLWDEDRSSGTLKLLSMIPRSWLADGKEIILRDCVSTLGRFSLRVQTEKGTIHASMSFDRRPEKVLLRLPHPTGTRASGVEGGTYDAERETVLVGNSEVRLRFG